MSPVELDNLLALLQQQDAFRKNEEIARGMQMKHMARHNPNAAQLQKLDPRAQLTGQRRRRPRLLDLLNQSAGPQPFSDYFSESPAHLPAGGLFRGP